MQHRRAPYLTVAAVTAAFVVGGVATPATAGAARLTKGKVEKIAAKVVDQKAPALKVAHATTADTATTATTAVTATRATTAASAENSSALGGREAADFLTTVWTVPSEDLRADPATNVAWTFTDLPTGTYLLDYDLHFEKGDAASTISCSAVVLAGHNTPSLGRSQSSTRTVSGSALITLSGTDRLAVGCGSSTGTVFITASRQVVSSLTLTRVDAERTAAVTTQASNPEVQ